MTENSVVPEVLDDNNYDKWSSWMKIYLLGQDLWDVIEPETETETGALLTAEDSSKKDTKSWRRKNALALHAILMSCERESLSKIAKLESAKEAWDLLRSTNIKDHQQVPLTHRHCDSSHVGDPLDSIEEEQSTQIEDDMGYLSFMRSAEEDEGSKTMKQFLSSYPQATEFYKKHTPLHTAIANGYTKISKVLIDEMSADDDLKIVDKDGYTALARGANKNYPGILELLKSMVSKNSMLPDIGQDEYSIPVVMASWKGFKDVTHYLYGVTSENILNPEYGMIGVNLLINCISIKLFDIASDLVKKFPKLLQQHNRDGKCPIHALAKMFSGLQIGPEHDKSSIFNFNNWLSKSWKYKDMPKVSRDVNLVHDQARPFLQLVCDQVSTFDNKMLSTFVYAAMIEAAKNGIGDFIIEMLRANPNLIEAHLEGKGIFWHAVENRQENVFNLIYEVIEDKDSLLSCVNKDGNNILHLVAKLPPSSVLDRSAGPALQMQRELQWFREVWNVAKPRYREDLNKEKLTPHEVFTAAHEKLIDAGEKAMKHIAQSSTVVGTLIVTIMFAAAFAVPGGNNQTTGYPLLVSGVWFKLFIISDALSLYFSTTSIMVFLGILTSRYAEDDFLILLPGKLMIGVFTLFCSLTTMMVTFCSAIAIMLDGYLQFSLPIVLVALVPIILFWSSIFPLLSKIHRSTFGPSIFRKNTKFLKKEEVKMVNNPSSDTRNIRKSKNEKNSEPSVFKGSFFLRGPGSLNIRKNESVGRYGSKSPAIFRSMSNAV